MKKFGFIFVASVLLSGCMTLSLPDDWQEQRKQAEEEQKKQEEEDKTPAVLTYFAFLKEDNPDLEEDIVCTNLEPQNLLMIPNCDLGLPRMLKPRFSLDKGVLIYNGDEMTSGESEMYCSYDQNAPIRRESGSLKTYHNVTFATWTGLPVVEITSETSIKTEWQDAFISVHGQGVYADIQMDSVKVKRRGNSTAYQPKTPFNVKFGKKTSVLGMPKGKRWCFLANYRDRSMLRNNVALELGHMADNMEWNPHSVFAEVYYNGEHIGLYEVTEAIRQNENRVDVEELTAGDTDPATITGGYIIEVDDHFDRTFKFKTEAYSWPVNVRYPKDDDMNYEQFAYIRDFINDLERALDGGNFEYLRDAIDYPSFVDMFIVEQAMGCQEFCSSGSIYLHKKRGGKLCSGPLWDFEHQSLVSEDNQKVYNALWYPYLLDDPEFATSLKKRWPVLKERFESRIYDYIDEKTAQLALSMTFNDALYPLKGLNFNNLDADLTFEEAADRLKTVLRARIAWMDELIASF